MYQLKAADRGAELKVYCVGRAWLVACDHLQAWLLLSLRERLSSSDPCAAVLLKTQALSSVPTASICAYRHIDNAMQSEPCSAEAIC